MKVWYRIPEECDESFYDIEIPDPSDLMRPIEQDWIVKECAEHYYQSCDGWESSWPLVISLHITEHGEEIARFDVEMDFDPVFYASRVVIDNE